MSDRITVTMLGTSKSGKTTYLLGMYATLSAGQDGFFLHADDPDLDLDLSESWDALMDEGLLPPPTPNEPKTYPFVFKSGLTRLLDIDWLDYRGGAMTDRTTASDAERLVSRLAASDSIYLTLDGALLAQGVDERSFLTARRHTKAERMTWFVQNAASKLGRVPSLVVLVTKFDLVAARCPDGAAAVESAIDAARDILPIAFETGVTALICPVSLGDLGMPVAERVDPTSVAPRWVHKPMLFLDAGAQIQEQRELASRMAAGQSNLSETTYELAQLKNGFFSIFRGAEMERKQGEAARTAEQIEAAHRNHERAERQAARLAEQFADLPIFADGERIAIA